MVHFLKRTTMGSVYEFKHYNNYQIILGEQTPEDLMKDSANADVFLYQTTPSIKYGTLSTEEMCRSVVPKSCLKVAFGYGYNHGFFPLVNHGNQWKTSLEVMVMAERNPEELLVRYDLGHISFGCLERFHNCLTEQQRREVVEKQSADEAGAFFIPMSQHILAIYKSRQLFICENHPASEYFSALSRRVFETVNGNDPGPLEYSSNNESNLPCGMLVSPFVVRELGLDYDPEPLAHEYFKGHLKQLIKDMTK
jgi:hypothetical protein